MWQKVLGGGSRCVGRMGVGWGVWSWAIIGVDRMQGGEGFTCVLFKGIGKILGWGLIRGINGSVWFVKMVWGVGEWCVVCTGKGWRMGM